MAKAKADTPPFQMIVEKGPRLVPATPFDAERLDTWRIGSKVSVQFVRNGGRPMERKWFAILGLVVAQCDVPWKTKEQASEAIKLFLGIVHYGKTVSGAYMHWPKSLTELSDPELDDAVRDMVDLVHRMTGVDPETLRKETGYAGEEYEPSDVSSLSDEGSGDESSLSTDPAPTDTAAADPAPEEDASPPAKSSGADKLSDEDRKWLKMTAKMLWAAIGELDVLKRQRVAIQKTLTPEGIGVLAKQKAEAIYKRCKAVLVDGADKEKAFAEILLIAGAGREEILT